MNSSSNPQSGQKIGQCPNCDARGKVGEKCRERVCTKRGYRYIPEAYAKRHTSEQEGLIEPLIGRTIGDYLAVDVLGVGGFGKVYLALQMPIMMKTALKLMDRAKFPNKVLDTMLKKFEGEAAALAALNHPNIVRLLKYGIHNSLPYLVMELVDSGRTLKREIQNRAVRGQQFKPEEVHHILRQLLAALEAAHRHEIVHRDVKPDNIMLQELAGHRNFVRVLDFGMAKFVQERSDTNFAMGTPTYMAPEQLLRKNIGPWTDLYAVGVMAYELITGRRPFGGRTHQEIVAAKMDPDYDPVQRLRDLPVPQFILTFLSKALAFDPSDRFASAEILRKAMDAMFDELKSSRSSESMGPVEVSELVDSTDMQRLESEQQRLESERARLLAEKERVERERRRLDEERRRLEQARKSLKSGRISDEWRRTSDTSPSGFQAADVIRAGIDQAEAQGDWIGVIEGKEHLMPLARTDVEKFAIQVSVGDIYREKLHETERAAEAYTRALEYGSFSKAPLLLLVQIHVDAKRFGDAIACFDKLIDAEAEPTKKATYAAGAAALYRDALEDYTRAVRYYNMALDFDPSKVESFRALEEILTRTKSWKGLARAYQQMIARVSRAGDAYDNPSSILFLLYRNLGEILHKRVEDHRRATTAYERAFKLRPREERVRETLLELYETMGETEKAAEQHRLRIKAHPERFESYHRLVQLYRKLGHVDRAWCVAGLLVGFGKASDQEEIFYWERAPAGPAALSRPLTDEDWLLLVVGPPEAPRLERILGIIYETLRPHLREDPPKNYGMKRKDRVDPAGRSPFARVLGRTLTWLNVRAPEVYTDRKRSGFHLVPSTPPALTVGLDEQNEPDPKVMAFRLGRELSYFHSWHVMGTVYDDEQLTLMLMAAGRLTVPGYAVRFPPETEPRMRRMLDDHVESIRAELDAAIAPRNRAELGRLMSKLPVDEFPDITAWRGLVETTATHAGLLLAGDIALVADQLREEDDAHTVIARGGKLKDHVLWTLSNRYVKLRKELGLRVG